MADFLGSGCLSWTVAVLVLVSACSIARADCPSACSGHGSCGIFDNCECQKGYTGGDCSLRLCPQGFAWTDIHQGDLNHDGRNVLSDKTYLMDNRKNANLQIPEFFPTDKDKGGFAAGTNEAHFYQECSARGICDRHRGVCKCFRGHTGSACHRSTCPNGCTGHGTCRTVGDIARYALNKREVDAVAGERKFEGVQQPFEYRSWDSEMQHACICDPGYFGMDCSMRDCPRGDDPLTTEPYTCGGAHCRNHQQTITFDMDHNVDRHGMVSLVFTDHYLTEWETFGHRFRPRHENSTAADWLRFVESSLESLPGAVVQNVKVNCHTDLMNIKSKCTTNQLNNQDKEFHITVEFVRPTGIVYPLKVNYYGNTLRSMAFEDGEPVMIIPQEVREDQIGNKERSPCSNRGLCDHNTGLCECFPGYTFKDCSVQDVNAGVRSGQGVRNQRRSESAPASEGATDNTISEVTSDQ